MWEGGGVWVGREGGGEGHGVADPLHSPLGISGRHRGINRSAAAVPGSYGGQKRA